MSHFHEHGFPPPEEGVGVVAQRSTTLDPSLSEEGNDVAILMPSGEPKDHAICAQGRL